MLATATTMQLAREELAAGEITQAMHDKLAARLVADAVPYNGTEQLLWIASTLQASTADWLFVVGHFPVYSGGAHGDTPELVEVRWRVRMGGGAPRPHATGAARACVSSVGLMGARAAIDALAGEVQRGRVLGRPQPHAGAFAAESPSPAVCLVCVRVCMDA